MSLEQLTTGVISGIVAAALFGLGLFLVRTIWKSVVEPWWENKLYGDARLDGEWIGTLVTSSTNPDEEHITVRQTGHSIEGDIHCISGPDKGRQYKFVGCVRNQILSGYYWNVDPTSIDSGSFSLRLVRDGSVLDGHTVYYNDRDHSLLSREYKWKRNKVPSGESTIESPQPSSGNAESP